MALRLPTTSFDRRGWTYGSGESKERLWHRLDNESGRAYEAFKVYMCLQPAERSMVRAWREWSRQS